MVKHREARRKAAFEAALKLNEMTAAEWARLHDVTPEHLSMVLAGKRESGRLFSIMDDFIAEMLPHVRVAQSA